MRNVFVWIIAVMAPLWTYSRTCVKCAHFICARSPALSADAADAAGTDVGAIRIRNGVPNT